jgi:hypothetical protein
MSDETGLEEDYETIDDDNNDDNENSNFTRSDIID